MGTIRKVTKISKETEEEYEAWVINPDESKDYSDFRYVNNTVGKVLEYFEEKCPDKLQEFQELLEGDADVDLADFIIQELL